MRLIKLAAAGVMMMAGSLAAHAQSNACMNKVRVDAVYQTGKGANSFEYFVAVRNLTAERVSASLRFVGAFEGVSLFSRELPVTTLEARKTQQIRFGTGTSQQVNNGTVPTMYDKAGSAKQYVLVVNCR